jgi:hypothetical protein
MVVMNRPRYATPWWSHALSAVALALITVFIFGMRAVEIYRETGGVGWYAAGTFLSLFLAVHRAMLALRGWRSRNASGEGAADA